MWVRGLIYRMAGGIWQTPRVLFDPVVVRYGNTVILVEFPLKYEFSLPLDVLRTKHSVEFPCNLHFSCIMEHISEKVNKFGIFIACNFRG